MSAWTDCGVQFLERVVVTEGGGGERAQGLGTADAENDVALMVDWEVVILRSNTHTPNLRQFGQAV